MFTKFLGKEVDHKNEREKEGERRKEVDHKNERERGRESVIFLSLPFFTLETKYQDKLFARLINFQNRNDNAHNTHELSFSHK